MKSEKFNKAINDLKNINLSYFEKETIKRRILSAPIVSPYQKRNVFYAIILKHKQVAYAFATVVIFLSSVRVLVYASEKTIPGDLLYMTKTNIVEPLYGLLNTTPAERARFELFKATRRLTEAETLLAQNKLDVATKNNLEKKFTENSQAFTTNANEIKTTNNTEYDQLKLEYDAKINAHLRIMEIVEEQTSKPGQNELHNFQQNIIQNVEKNTEKEPNKETKRNDSSIGNSRTVSNSEKTFENRASEVKTIIDDVHKNIEKTENRGGVDKLHEAIINDSSTTVSKAEDLLKQAGEQKRQGDINSAFSSLQKSNIGAEEARTSIDDGLKINTGKSVTNSNESTSGSTSTSKQIEKKSENEVKVLNSNVESTNSATTNINVSTSSQIENKKEDKVDLQNNNSNGVVTTEVKGDVKTSSVQKEQKNEAQDTTKR